MSTRARFVACVAVAAIGAVGVLAGPANAAKGPNSTNAKACQKSGWTTLVRADLTAFGNESECVSYGAKGGTLTTPPPAPARLAIAYTNLDGVPGFGPGDVLIAQLTDTNGDGIPSAGDTVTTGYLPRTLTPTTFPDDFVMAQVTSHLVSDAIVGASHVTVQVDDGHAGFAFVDDVAGAFETYTEYPVPSNGHHDVFVLDWTERDRMRADPDSPSLFTSAVEDTYGNVNGGDNAFLEVDLNPAP